MSSKKQVIKKEHDAINNPIYVPDMPAHMIEPPVTEDEIVDIQTVNTTEPELKVTTCLVQQVIDSDEVLFLKKILHIQHNGGFGRHLDFLINERIKELKNGG